MACEDPLLDYVNPIFVGLKLTHTDRFFITDKLSEEKVRFIIGRKISAQEAIFTRSVYAVYNLQPDLDVADCRRDKQISGNQLSLNKLNDHYYRIWKMIMTIYLEGKVGCS